VAVLRRREGNRKSGVALRQKLCGISASLASEMEVLTPSNFCRRLIKYLQLTELAWLFITQ